PAAAALRARRAGRTGRRCLRQAEARRDEVHGLLARRAAAAERADLPRLADAARAMAEGCRSARGRVRRRRRARRSERGSQDLPALRPAHALPRVREILRRVELGPDGIALRLRSVAVIHLQQALAPGEYG